MSGKLLLDTNAVIALLNGHATLQQLCAEAEWIGVSIITELEFRSFHNLSASDAALFQQFKARIQVISLDKSDAALLETVVELRKTANLKLPDAIIAATCLTFKARLVSNDAVFGRVDAFQTIAF